MDLRISEDGLTLKDIEDMCDEVGKGDEDKDQEVVLAVLTVSKQMLNREGGEEESIRKLMIQV